MDGSGLKLAGELDAVTLPMLTELFDAQNGRNGRPNVVLDLSELTFIDSCGIHAIVSFARSREAIGTVTLTGSSAFLRKLFEITQIIEVPNLRVDGSA